MNEFTRKHTGNNKSNPRNPKFGAWIKIIKEK